jgi:propionyl-CoA carboxylase alpha chain
MKPIRKLLVANRGEIALRVMRSAREMGIQTVAVYSEADRLSPHVLFADEAVLLGPPPSNQSYLLADKIIEACKRLKVDAVHPGYGFLSENATFARTLEREGIILVGPTAESMDKMGNKLAAKQTVLPFGIPMVPGLETAITDIAFAKKRATEIGFPVLIKAAAGGGGTSSAASSVGAGGGASCSIIIFLLYLLIALKRFTSSNNFFSNIVLIL